MIAESQDSKKSVHCVFLSAAIANMKMQGRADAQGDSGQRRRTADVAEL